MEALIPLLFFVGLIALSFAIAYFSQQRISRAWGELAERAGLTCEARGFLQSPRVSGVYRGRPLVLDTYTTGSGRNRTTYTRITLDVRNPANGSFALYNETVFSKIGKVLGMQDIQTGDEELDKHYIIKGQPPSFTLSVLNSIGVRQKLQQIRSINVQLSGDDLRFVQIGVLTNVEQLQSVIDFLGDVAEIVDRAG